MQKMLFLSLLFITACASKSRGPTVEVPPGSWELQQALEAGLTPTLAHLRANASGKSYDVLHEKDPAAVLPATLKAQKHTQTSNEKNQRQRLLKKFRNWSLQRKIKKGAELLTQFTCEKSLESQTLGLSLELDFPENEAVQLSQGLLEKTLSCPEFAKNESLLRLSVFAIQRGECPKAQEYLNMFPESADRGIQDRLTYLRSLCDPDIQVSSSNPWGGYGILLNDHKPIPKNAHWPRWYLSTSSGSEEWDRLLVTFMELSEKGHSEVLRHLASKIDSEKFRALPLPFQTSILVLMSYNGADLSVFQLLHKYLSDNPEMISPSVTGLLFPIRYWKEIVDNSPNTDPVLVKALIRQESAFNPSARSRAKAAGLMQLLYPTARAFGMKSSRQLTTPEENIRAGSEFLGRLIRDFGSIELALAAYNAGPGIVRQWQRRYPTNNVDVFVELIPYTETREYVRLVTRNYKIYQSLLVKPMVLGDRQQR